jgi:hypothetical protein
MANSQVSEKSLKAWLNYNCSQGNNWITLYKFGDIISHTGKHYFEVDTKGVHPKLETECQIKSDDLKHVYFTYMTDDTLITLIETTGSDLYLIKNNLTISEDNNETTNQPDAHAQVEQNPPSVVEFTDDMIDNYKTNNNDAVKRVDDVSTLPQLTSVDSNIYHLSSVKCLIKCMTSKDLKNIGIRQKKWLSCELKKVQKDELSGLSYMDFIGLSTNKQYAKLFEKYLEQSGTTLNLTHNYSVTPEILNSLKINKKIDQLIIQQNFQIDDFSWLKNFPNLKMMNFWYDQRIEQKHIEQIATILPDLEVFNLHSCCRVNIRFIIPLLKLKNIEKIAIDDPYFWCQKSIHELFILPDEWKNIYCPSLQKLAINSKNLTLDVLDYILIACPNIQQFLVDEDILTMITRNIIGGHDKDSLITFHSWQQPNKGFQINKKLTFKNMFKDTYSSQMFSESMLKKIKENKLKKGEADQLPVLPKGSPEHPSVSSDVAVTMNPPIMTHVPTDVSDANLSTVNHSAD